MTDLSFAAPLYYKHSGRFSLAPLIFAVFASVALAMVGAALFAYIEVYTPIAGYVTFLLILGFGLYLGRGTATLLHRAKVRNTLLVSVIGVLIGFIAIYSAWAIWIYAFLHRNMPAGHALANLSIWQLFVHPAALWRIITILDDVGPWTIGSDLHPTGIFLALLWLIEAGGIMYLAVKLPMRKIIEVPFCEQCQKWGTTRQILQTNVADDASLRRDIEQKKFGTLPALGLLAGANTWYNLSLQGCAGCDSMQTLTVDRFTLTRDRNNKSKMSHKTLLRQMRLSPEETVQLCQVAAEMSVPPAPPEVATPVPKTFPPAPS